MTKRLLISAEYATKAADKAEQAQRQQRGQAIALLTKEGETIWLDPITPLVYSKQHPLGPLSPPLPYQAPLPTPRPRQTPPPSQAPPPPPQAPLPPPPPPDQEEEEEEKEEEQGETRGSTHTSSFPELLIEDPYRPPPSTAPAAVPSGRPKRQRGITDYKALHNTGAKRGGCRR